jgi:hypothetical protein
MKHLNKFFTTSQNLDDGRINSFLIFPNFQNSKKQNFIHLFLFLLI